MEGEQKMIEKNNKKKGPDIGAMLFWIVGGTAALAISAGSFFYGMSIDKEEIRERREQYIRQRTEQIIRQYDTDRRPGLSKEEFRELYMDHFQYHDINNDDILDREETSNLVRDLE